MATNDNKMKGDHSMDYEDNGFEMLADYPDILKPAEVMEILGIRKNLFYELVNDGRLKASKIGKIWRIPKTSIFQFMKDSEN